MATERCAVELMGEMEMKTLSGVAAVCYNDPVGVEACVFDGA